MFLHCSEKGQCPTHGCILIWTSYLAFPFFLKTAKYITLCPISTLQTSSYFNRGSLVLRVCIRWYISQQTQFLIERLFSYCFLFLMILVLEILNFLLHVSAVLQPYRQHRANLNQFYFYLEINFLEAISFFFIQINLGNFTLHLDKMKGYLHHCWAEACNTNCDKVMS